MHTYECSQTELSTWSFMHACLCLLSLAEFLWSIRHFVFAIIPCQQHLGRQTIAEKIGSQTPFTVNLAGQRAKQQVTHTHMHTHKQTVLYMYSHASQTHTHPHREKHTRVPLRCTLLTPSPGSLQRVVVQFSRTRLSDIPSLPLSLSLSPLTLAYSLCLSHTLSFASRLQDAATTDASVSPAFLLSSLSLPFPSPLLSVCSWEAELILSKPCSVASLFYFQVSGSVRTRRQEKEEDGREKEERTGGEDRSAGRTDQTDVPLQDTRALQTVSHRESYCREDKQIYCTVAAAEPYNHTMYI